MIKITYDYQIFSSQKYGGISRYIYELSRNLAASHTPRVSCSVLSPLYINAYLGVRHPTVPIVGIRVPALRYTGRLRRLFNQHVSRCLMQIWHPDLVHETYYASHTAAPRGVAIVLTVYDMIHEIFAEYFRKNDRTSEMKRLAVDRADHVICISENTRRDLVRLFGVPEEKTTVVPLASSLDIEAATLGPSVDGPFILYVGARGGYKNFDRLLEAYAGSRLLREDFKLVCFGGRPFSKDELLRMCTLGVSEGHVFHFAGGDDALRGLYRDAELFVYPSLYEGFGIPPLEAMGLGCPVACSNAGSIPEVVGEAAALFDPYDVGSMIDALERCTHDAQLTKGMRSEGRRRARLFSWERCASETIEVYSKVLE